MGKFLKFDCRIVLLLSANESRGNVIDLSPELWPRTDALISNLWQSGVGWGLGWAQSSLNNSNAIKGISAGNLSLSFSLSASFVFQLRGSARRINGPFSGLLSLSVFSTRGSSRMRKTEWKSNLIDKINTAALIAFDLQQGRKWSKYHPRSLVKIARNVPLHS